MMYALNRELEYFDMPQVRAVVRGAPRAVASESNLTYEREFVGAIEAVDRGAQVAFLLNAVDVDVVMKVASSGEVLPQKATDFYPKLLSGITMYRVGE
jgi:uncharacterized protein (DUF1015 family)